MKRLDPKNCSVVVFNDLKEDFTKTLDLLHTVFSNGNIYKIYYLR